MAKTDKKKIAVQITTKTDRIVGDLVADRAHNVKSRAIANDETLHVIGFEQKPYYNSISKANLVKFILVEKKELSGSIYRHLVGRNVLATDVIEIVQERDLEKLKKIHKKRSKRFNYGFQLQSAKK